MRELLKKSIFMVEQRKIPFPTLCSTREKFSQAEMSVYQPERNFMQLFGKFQGNKLLQSTDYLCLVHKRCGKA